MAGYGSIGAFYLGESVNAIVIPNPVQFTLSATPVTVIENEVNTFPNLNLFFQLLNPTVAIYNNLEVDFSASPLYGKSPLSVNFTALPLISNTFSGSIINYQWVFDLENNPNTVVTTTSPNITHVYSGKDGDKFTVKLTVLYSPNLNGHVAYATKIDYIELENSSKRYGLGKRINLRNYVPKCLYKSETYNLIYTFEDYLNEMYDGENGLIINSEIEDNINVLTIDSVDTTSKISVLEKIYRIIDLHDPDLMDVENIQFYANNLGYNVDVDKSQFGVEADNERDVESYLRFMVSNLPNWYKIKTTRNSVKAMLFSFGLIGDVVYYYTKDYDENNDSWMYAGIYFDEVDNKLKENLKLIPSNWFPTSHFSVWYDINKSNVNFSYDSTKQSQIINAVESVRPVNTVFKGIIGNWKTSVTVRVNTVHKISKFVRVNGNSSDYWNE